METKNKGEIMESYKAFSNYLGAKDNRPLCNNTRAIRLADNRIGIKLHDTIIIEYHKSGLMVLNSGGWKTATTKDRLNRFTPLHIYQDKGVWYVFDNHYNNANDNNVPFSDGMKYNTKTNKFSNVKMSTPKKILRTNEQIKTYVNGYVEAFLNGDVPAPSGKDCWYCSLFVSGNTEHLTEHMKESYYVPSLLARALEQYGSRYTQMQVRGIWYGDPIDIDSPYLGDCLKQSLTRYLKIAFGIAR